MLSVFHFLIIHFQKWNWIYAEGNAGSAWMSLEMESNANLKHLYYMTLYYTLKECDNEKCICVCKEIVITILSKTEL